MTVGTNWGKILAAALVLGLVALLATLTWHPHDPCADGQLDLSGAVLAEQDEQSAMTNRAILQRAACEPPEPQ